MSYLYFCNCYGYNQRDDMARESYNVFIVAFNVITSKENNINLLAFLGLKGYLMRSIAAKR